MRWLLTYSDLITLLMVFFVVLYSMSQLDQQKFITLSTSLRQTLLGQQSGDAAIKTAGPPAVVPDNLPEQKTLADLGDELAQQAEKAGLADKVRVSLGSRGLVVSFSTETAFFALGKADLQPPFRELLMKLGPILNRVPNPVEIDGYTDDQQINTALFPTNWELSARRASNVVRFLSEEAGVDPHRLRAVAYGEYHPKYPNDTPKHRALNRRVDLVVLRASTNDANAIAPLVLLDTSHVPPITPPPSASQ